MASHAKEVRADATVLKAHLKRQLSHLQRKLMATPGTRHYVPSYVSRGGGSVGSSRGLPPAHRGHGTSTSMAGTGTAGSLSAPAPELFHTHHDLFRAAQNRAESYVRDEETKLRKQLNTHLSEAERRSVEADARMRRARGFGGAPPKITRPSTTGSGVIVDARARAADQLATAGRCRLTPG